MLNGLVSQINKKDEVIDKYNKIDKNSMLGRKFLVSLYYSNSIMH